MKKLYVLFLSFICLCSLCAFAENGFEYPSQKTQSSCSQPCPSTMQRPRSECFLCTKQNMFLPYRLTNRAPWYLPKELKTCLYTKTGPWVFIAVLFIIAKTWKQPKCPSASECIHKRWYIQTRVFFSTRKK